MKDALIVSILSVAPRRSGARGMGWFARTRTSRALVRLFARLYAVDLSEVENDPGEYPNLEAFFTRRLKPGARPVDDRPGAIVSPVDGRVAALARTVGGAIEVAPRRRLDVSALVSERLDGERDVVVLYLSPRDYHRVHVPREGKVLRWSYLPGTLWPVFPAAVRHVRGLFQRNERAVVTFETDHGQLHVALVGAFGVGRITLSVCNLVTNTGRRWFRRPRVETLNPPWNLDRGEELGVFHLGSTVVLVVQPGRFTWTVRPGDTVRMGRAIGMATAALPAPG